MTGTSSEEHKGIGQKLKDVLHIGKNKQTDSDAVAGQGAGPLATGTGNAATRSDAAPGHHHTTSAGGPLSTGATAPGAVTSTGATAPGAVTSTGPPGATTESKNTNRHTSDLNEKGMVDSVGNIEEFKRAKELTEQAMRESAKADALTKEAYEKVEVANRYRREAEEANSRSLTAKQELDRHEAALAAARQVAQSATIPVDLDSNQKRAHEAAKEAEAAAAAARKRYNEAKDAADHAAKLKEEADKLANEAAARRKNLEGLQTREAALQEEALRGQKVAAAAVAGVERKREELTAAQQLIAEREAELKKAKEIHDATKHELSAEEKAVHDAKKTADKKLSEAEQLHHKTVKAQEDLASMEKRLVEAEQEAAKARAATVEYADAARAERERALAARAEADKAAKVLEEAKAFAGRRQRELDAAKATAAEEEAAMGPLRKQISELEHASKTKHASAEHAVREWSDVHNRANLEKGKWHEHWTAAKEQGDLGDKKAEEHFQTMTSKMKEIVPDFMKDSVEKVMHGDKSNLHAENRTGISSEDYAARSETGPNVDTHGVFNTQANAEGPGQLDRAKAHQAQKVAGITGPTGATGTTGAAGPTARN